MAGGRRMGRGRSDGRRIIERTKARRARYRATFDYVTIELAEWRRVAEKVEKHLKEASSWAWVRV